MDIETLHHGKGHFPHRYLRADERILPQDGQCYYGDESPAHMIDNDGPYYHQHHLCYSSNDSVGDLYSTSHHHHQAIQHYQHQKELFLHQQISVSKHSGMVIPKKNSSRYFDGTTTNRLFLRTLKTTTHLLESYDKRVRWAADLVDVHTYKVPKTAGYWTVLRKKFRKAVDALKDDVDL